MLLITIVELCVVAGSRTWAGGPQAISRRPCCAVALRRTARSEQGMASVNQTRHGRGTAWARHMRELAFNLSCAVARLDIGVHTASCLMESGGSLPSQ
jgi:hypothetical protein